MQQDQLPEDVEKRFDHEWMINVNGGEYPSDRFKRFFANELSQSKHQGAMDALGIVDRFLSAPKRNKYYHPDSIDRWDIVGIRDDLEEEIKKIALTPTNTEGNV